MANQDIEIYKKMNDHNKKIIDLMVDRLEFVMKNANIGLDFEHGMNFTQEDIKKYFENKLEYPGKEELQNGIN